MLGEFASIGEMVYQGIGCEVIQVMVIYGYRTQHIPAGRRGPPVGAGGVNPEGFPHKSPGGTGGPPDQKGSRKPLFSGGQR